MELPKTGMLTQTDSTPAPLTKPNNPPKKEKVKSSGSRINLEKKKKEVVVVPVIISDPPQTSTKKEQEKPKAIPNAETEKIKSQLKEANAALDKKDQDLIALTSALEKAKQELELKEQQLTEVTLEKEALLKTLVLTIQRPTIEPTPVIPETKQIMVAGDPEINATKRDSIVSTAITGSSEENKIIVINDPEINAAKKDSIVSIPAIVKTETKEIASPETAETTAAKKSDIEPLAPVFITMLDIKAGLSIFNDNVETSNGLDFEASYSLLNSYGLGIEAGLNIIYLPMQEGSSPYINPFLGLPFGKYYPKFSFAVSPRIYFVSSPGFKRTSELDNHSTTTKIVPSFMIGAGANFKYKLNERLALSIYGSYITGMQELKESGTKDGADYTNVTENKIKVLGVGIGGSYTF